MPNHAHFMIRVPEDVAINMVLGNSKRFIAYEIIKSLQAGGRSDILKQLSSGLRPSDLARSQKHRVFETSTDLIKCFSGKMIEEKLKYIHANPVSKRLVPP